METVDLNNLRETYLVANDWITRNIVKKKKQHQTKFKKLRLPHSHNTEIVAGQKKSASDES